MSKPIKNPDTEARCQAIAATARTDRAKANDEYKAMVDGLKLWEQLAIQDRILAIIKERKAPSVATLQAAAQAANRKLGRDW